MNEITLMEIYTQRRRVLKSIRKFLHASKIFSRKCTRTHEGDAIDLIHLSRRTLHRPFLCLSMPGYFETLVQHTAAMENVARPLKGLTMKCSQESDSDSVKTRADELDLAMHLLVVNLKI
jgi:hypothetical protein